MTAEKFLDNYKYLGIASLLDWTAKDSEVYNMICDCMEAYHQAKTKDLKSFVEGYVKEFEENGTTGWERYNEAKELLKRI